MKFKPLTVLNNWELGVMEKNSYLHLDQPFDKQVLTAILENMHLPQVQTLLLDNIAKTMPIRALENLTEYFEKSFLDKISQYLQDNMDFKEKIQTQFCLRGLLDNYRLVDQSIFYLIKDIAEKLKKELKLDKEIIISNYLNPWRANKLEEPKKIKFEKVLINCLQPISQGLGKSINHSIESKSYALYQRLSSLAEKYQISLLIETAKILVTQHAKALIVAIPQLQDYFASVQPRLEFEDSTDACVLPKVLTLAVTSDATVVNSIRTQDKFWSACFAAMKQVEQPNVTLDIEAGERIIRLVLGIYSLQANNFNLQIQKENLIKKALKNSSVVYLFVKTMIDKSAQEAESLNIECLNYLQALGINLDVKNELGQTFLHLAVSAQHKEFICWFLIHYPYLLNAQDNQSNTALLMAVLADYSDIVKVLVEHGARWDLCNNVGQRVDEIALNHQTLLRDMLLTYQQQLFAAAEQTKLALIPQNAWDTHFLFAVKTNQLNLVKKIITAGKINLLKYYEQGFTILHIVIQHNYLALIAYFIEHKKSLIEKTDLMGRTPLLLAAQLGHCQAIELLLNVNANLDAVDHDYNSVWELAAGLEVKTLLLKFIQEPSKVSLSSIILQQKLLDLVDFSQGKNNLTLTPSIVIPGYGVLSLKSQASNDIGICVQNSQTNPNGGGTHRWFIYAGIHFKLNPSAPGLDMTTHLLNQNLFKEGLAPSVFIKLKLTQGEELVLAADAIKGITLEQWLKQKPQAALNIHPVDFCRLVVLAWLTDPGDNKLDNYLIQSHANAKNLLKLIGVDNEKIFEPTIVQRVDGKHITYIRCILFLLTQMNSLFNATIRQQLLNLNVESCLLTWLSQLNEYESAYQKLMHTAQFAAEELAYSVSSSALTSNNSVNFIRFIPGTISRLYHKFKHLQKLLVSNHQLTYRAIWHELDPVTASFYQAVQEKFSTFQDQVNALYRNFEAGHGETFESLSAFTNNQHLKTVLANACDNDYRPKFSEVQLKTAKFASISFKTQTLDEARAELISAIDWQELNEVQQLNVINQIALDAYSQKTLSFKNCQGLNDDTLMLLGNLKALQTLTLVNCSVSLKGLSDLVHLFHPQLHLKLGKNTLLTQNEWQEILENPLFLQVSCLLSDGSEVQLKPLSISNISKIQAKLQNSNQTDTLANLIWTFWHELTWIKTLLQATKKSNHFDNYCSSSVSNFFELNTNKVISEKANDEPTIKPNI